MNYKENFICSKDKLKQWRDKYKLKKVYTKFYQTTLSQEIAWFFIITMFGIIGQILFRLYYARKFFSQYWWILIIYFWMPIYSIVPALFLCMNFFWIDKIEHYYNTNVRRSKKWPLLIKLMFIIIIRLFKPSYVPLII